MSEALNTYRTGRAKIARLSRLEMEKLLIASGSLRAVHDQWDARLIKARAELGLEQGSGYG